MRQGLAVVAPHTLMGTTTESLPAAPKIKYLKNILSKLIIITAPSGSGKSTIANAVLATMPELCFSISATTRQPRGAEVHGQHYYFITVPDFEQKIKDNQFIEWEKVYANKYYGTLQQELQRIWTNNQVPVLDIDVQGAIQLKQKFGANLCTIFIQVPIELLQQRLQQRGTDTPEAIAERLAKATSEAALASQFDHIIENINLDTAIQNVRQVIHNFVHNGN